MQTLVLNIVYVLNSRHNFQLWSLCVSVKCSCNFLYHINIVSVNSIHKKGWTSKGKRLLTLKWQGGFKCPSWRKIVFLAPFHDAIDPQKIYFYQMSMTNVSHTLSEAQNDPKRVSIAKLIVTNDYQHFLAHFEWVNGHESRKTQFRQNFAIDSF